MSGLKAKRAALLSAVIIIAAIAGVMLNSEKSARGIINGVYFSLETLVPSVLPFMIIASFSVNSGVNLFAGKLLDRISRKFFGVSGLSAAAVIIGLFGGYPVAARGLEALYKKGKISAYEAGKCAYPSVCAGAGFVISFVGVRLFHSFETGAVILAAQVISVLILSILTTFVFKKYDYISNTELKETKLSTALIESVTDSTYAAIDMCAMVVVFSAVLEIIGEGSPLSVILEVTNACNILSKNNNVILTAFAVGFGGVCVHFQIFQALKDIGLNIWLFFLFRIIQGLITAGLTLVFIRLFNISTAVFSSFDTQPELGLRSSIAGSILLILTGVSLIYNFRKGG